MGLPRARRLLTSAGFGRGPHSYSPGFHPVSYVCVTPSTAIDYSIEILPDLRSRLMELALDMQRKTQYVRDQYLHTSVLSYPGPDSSCFQSYRRYSCLTFHVRRSPELRYGSSSCLAINIVLHERVRLTVNLIAELRCTVASFTRSISSRRFPQGTSVCSASGAYECKLRELILGQVLPIAIHPQFIYVQSI
jgi:hypothetical protein